MNANNDGNGKVVATAGVTTAVPRGHCEAAAAPISKHSNSLDTKLSRVASRTVAAWRGAAARSDRAPAAAPKRRGVANTYLTSYAMS